MTVFIPEDVDERLDLEADEFGIGLHEVEHLQSILDLVGRVQEDVIVDVVDETGQTEFDARDTAAERNVEVLRQLLVEDAIAECYGAALEALYRQVRSVGVELGRVRVTFGDRQVGRQGGVLTEVPKCTDRRADGAVAIANLGRCVDFLLLETSTALEREGIRCRPFFDCRLRRG